MTTRSPILDVGSPHAFNLARACIDECVKGHQLCCTISSLDPLLPTRLVDCTDPGRPCLVSTGGRRGTYLALSYVWGEAQPHRTTTSNLSAYTDGIALALLPQTLRDAIRVTYSLGFRYLWVDSLCIIQDSSADMRHEIGCMHLIYRRAYLTIIAASSARASSGFLQARLAAPHDIALPFICPSRSPTSGAGGDTAEVGTVHLADVNKVVRYSHMQEPISARGWCLQEYYMSPRALIFTSETVQFRCQSATQNVGNAFYDTEHEQRLPPVLFRTDAPPIERSSEEWSAVHKAWYRIVEDYTGRTVSKPSDKLVACGAIAEVFHRVRRAEALGYLAGLWYDTLLEDLLWGRPDGAPYLCRPPGFRAPSWSWAAVDGRVWMWGDLWMGLAKRTTAEVVHAEVALKDPELRFGQVTGGSIVLRAAMIQCGLCPSGDALHDILLPPVRWPGACCGLFGGHDHEVALSRAVSIDHEADVNRRTVWLVPLLREELYKSMLGLVVIPVALSDASEMASKNVYRRIGIFKLPNSADALHFDKSPVVEMRLV